MAKLHFILFDGTSQEVDAAIGASVMECAVGDAVPGIVAECGGACACATCHVYVHEDWIGRVGDAGSMEKDMLDFASGAGPNSRLSCQISVTSDLDGLIVSVPESQG